jgi:NADH-quinone oxidoreductase subunit G
LDAGAVPTLLPGGRPLAEDAARVAVERIWDAHVPPAAGRDLAGILAGANADSALLVGGVELADLPDPAAAEAALDRAGFVVSLELRRTTVTDYADVVFPVAAAAEKAGRYVTWEGRRRPFDLTLTGTGQLSDGRVLNALADELGVDLGLPTPAAARAELDQLGVTTTRMSAPEVAAPVRTTNRPGLALATWRELIDRGSLLDGEPNLAGTAKPLRAIMAKQTAADLELADGELVTVTAAGRSVSAPVELREDCAPNTVWLPASHRDGLLGAVHGSEVTVRRVDPNGGTS